MGPERLERMLAAILVADVVGYDRLQADDEEDTLRTERVYRRILRDLADRSHLKFTQIADAFVAGFPSASDAMSCALRIQEEATRRNRDVPAERQWHFKIGVHVGEVIVEGDRMAGTGVSVALNLAAGATPGGLCISGSAHDQLGAAFDPQVEDLGERPLGASRKPVRIYRVKTGYEREDLRAPTEERRLAAILEADAVRYSHHMATREDSTVDAVNRSQQTMASVVARHRGRVVDVAGDGVLAEFPTALDATRCGLDIQRELRATNEENPTDQRLDYRVGIHLGGVRVEGGRIFGSGVNIAARLEALADPQGVCISGTVHEQIRYKIDVEFQDLGEQRLKNIPHPVRAYHATIDGSRKRGGRGRFLRAAVVAAAVIAAGGVAWLLLR